MNDTGNIHSTAKAQGDAIGVSRWVIQAMRKAGREMGDPLGRYETRATLLAWLRRHRDFVAARWFPRKQVPVCTFPNLAEQAADKSGG
jgi:hypothetical protein